MARSRKQSATADEHNAETDEVRGEAFDHQSNVVDFRTPTERRLEREQKIRDLAERLDEATEEASLIRDQMKAIRLDAKAEGIDWKMLAQMTSARRKSESKRLAAENSRREIARAFGWDDGAQLDLLVDDRAEGLIPGQQREFMGETEDGLSPDKRAALESGFFTREELGVQ